MIRSIILLFFTLFVISRLFGQDHPCPDAIYNNYIEQAEKQKKTDFRKALANYNAARDWCPGLSKEVDGLIAKLFEEIEAQRAEAKRQERIAFQKTKEAEEALKRLEDATSQVFSYFMREADDMILRLDYEGALEKAKASIPLQMKPRELERRLIEITYFFNEAGKIERAIGIMDTIYRQVRRETPPALSSPSISAIRNELKSLEPVWFDTLHNVRYYPEMVFVEGGTFMMGCDEARGDKKCEYYEKPAHEVTLADFQIAKTETTVWQYFLFCNDEGIDIATLKDPGWGWSGDNPIVNITKIDAAKYANWLSKKKALPQFAYQIYEDELILKDGSPYSILRRIPDIFYSNSAFRLPSEAQWEYAARGGKKDISSVFSGGDSLNIIGWYDANSSSRTQPVGRKQSNELGLYDMSGNAEEWCEGGYYSYHSINGVLNNPAGKPPFSDWFSPVLRGGSWFHKEEKCLVYHRNYDFDRKDSDKLNYTGFRVAQNLLD